MKTMTGKPPSFSAAGRVPAHRKFSPEGGVIIATDAAVNHLTGRAGSGYVATSGLYGLAGHTQPAGIIGPSAVLVAELRSIWRAVSAVGNDTPCGGKITICTDSADALWYLGAWRREHRKFPSGYQLRDQRVSGKVSSLEKLANVMETDGDRYRLVKIAAHTGDHLNEAADSLAKLALRTGTRTGVSRTEAETAAANIARYRLEDYWESR